jgi:protein arginine kinase activator
MHKGLEHRGKVPERQARRLEQERELRGLHEKLREAVGKELYEEAALLRDQIRQLEGRN